MSKKSWIIISVAVLLFLIGSASQFFYFDSHQKQLTLDQIVPIYIGTMNKNLMSASVKPLALIHASTTITIAPDQLATWIEPYHRTFTGATEYRPARDKIRTDLAALATGFARAPADAELGVSGGAIIEEVPAIYGEALDIDASEDAIVRALIHDTGSAELVVAPVAPRISLAALPDLGIETLIGSGSSNFKGSIPSRVHNIKVGGAKLDHVIIPAGSEFSFNTTIGDISAATGYQPGLVIKNNSLVPEYGGGICQVATTMFRAAILTGLPIVERHNHSIPVHFYDPQGFDATIYPGVVDLRFTNDTPSNILIQTRIKGNTITFLMFGKSDGRTVTMEGPRRYDFGTDGSLKAVFSRTVIHAGKEPKKDTFYSSYRSPSLYPVVQNPLE